MAKKKEAVSPDKERKTRAKKNKNDGGSTVVWLGAFVLCALLIVLGRFMPSGELSAREKYIPGHDFVAKNPPIPKELGLGTPKFGFYAPKTPMKHVFYAS